MNNQGNSNQDNKSNPVKKSNLKDEINNLIDQFHLKLKHPKSRQFLYLLKGIVKKSDITLLLKELDTMITDQITKNTRRERYLYSEEWEKNKNVYSNEYYATVEDIKILEEFREKIKELNSSGGSRRRTRRRKKLRKSKRNKH
jgi:folylpolyglutamate synthase/dihydropteroate synthase